MAPDRQKVRKLVSTKAVGGMGSRGTPGLAPTRVPASAGSRFVASLRTHFVLRYCDVEIHRTARKHGIDDAAIRHAVEHAFTIVDLEPASDPPKVLAIGADQAGNLLEVIWLELADDAELVIHAMRLRTAFYDLLPTRPGEDTP